MSKQVREGDVKMLIRNLRKSNTMSKSNEEILSQVTGFPVEYLNDNADNTQFLIGVILQAMNAARIEAVDELVKLAKEQMADTEEDWLTVGEIIELAEQAKK